MIWFAYIRLMVDYCLGWTALCLYKLLYGKWGKGIKFKGIPALQMRSGARLFIDDQVQINSTNTFYHVNMFRPVKFLLDSSIATISIGRQSRIHGTLLHAKKSIQIGEGCLIAANCQIFDNNGHSLSLRSPEERLIKADIPKEVIIEDFVWLGTGVIVLPGTHIGKGTIVSANSVCKGVLKPNSIYAGNPAVCISDRDAKK
jgi:acetyltransferase-like isoleucine patch superfamily enzyme